jgi:hypothetical protein
MSVPSGPNSVPGRSHVRSPLSHCRSSSASSNEFKSAVFARSSVANGIVRHFSRRTSKYCLVLVDDINTGISQQVL